MAVGIAPSLGYLVLVLDGTLVYLHAISGMNGLIQNKRRAIGFSSARTPAPA